jgi:hypothetical protein
MGERFEEARSMIRAFLAQWPDAEWGPAHYILSDYNLDDCFLDATRPRLECLGDPQSAATVVLLERLRSIPEDDRCAVEGELLETFDDRAENTG